MAAAIARALIARCIPGAVESQNSRAFPVPALLSSSRMPARRFVTSCSPQVHAVSAPVPQRLTNDQARSQVENQVGNSGSFTRPAHDRVISVTGKEHFEQSLSDTPLVLVEYTRSSIPVASSMEAAYASLAVAAPDVTFLRVLSDTGPEQRQLCVDAAIARIPYFILYKNGEPIHKEEGLDVKRLTSCIQCYSDSVLAAGKVSELRSSEEYQAFITSSADKLVVVDFALHNCGPCVSIFPTLAHLSQAMEPDVVFGRVIGDENESCTQLLHSLDIVEVPTFVFARKGEVVGRYVGSQKGGLVGEILRYQGVQCT